MKLTRSTPATFALLAAAALALTGCSGGGSSVADTTWGDTAAKDTPSLTFKNDGTVSGTDGCNVLGGSWTQTGEKVQFDEVVSTLMFCEEVDDWLGGMDSAVVDGGTLVFSDKDGKEIGSLDKAGY